jgi:hypothetical protein
MPTIDYVIGQENAMREILAGPWLLRVGLDTNPSDKFESPRLASRLCTATQAPDDPRDCPHPADVTRNNPLLWVFDSAEYAPTDHDTNQE